MSGYLDKWEEKQYSTLILTPVSSVNICLCTVDYAHHKLSRSLNKMRLLNSYVGSITQSSVPNRTANTKHCAVQYSEMAGTS